MEVEPKAKKFQESSPVARRVLEFEGLGLGEDEEAGEAVGFGELVGLVVGVGVGDGAGSDL